MSGYKADGGSNFGLLARIWGQSSTLLHCSQRPLPGTAFGARPQAHRIRYQIAGSAMAWTLAPEILAVVGKHLLLTKVRPLAHCAPIGG